MVIIITQRTIPILYLETFETDACVVPISYGDFILVVRATTMSIIRQKSIERSAVDAIRSLRGATM